MYIDSEKASCKGAPNNNKDNGKVWSVPVTSLYIAPQETVSLVLGRIKRTGDEGPR